MRTLHPDAGLPVGRLDAQVTSRAPAVLIVAVLITGFLYSAAATVRLYRVLFALPAAAGWNASIDDSLRVVHLVSGDQLRDAMALRGWPPEADMVVLGPVSTVSDTDLTQIYYSASYLLYPRRIWLAAWCDGEAVKEDCARRHALLDPLAATASHHARLVMLVGPSNPFVHASSLPLSDRLSLVELE